jgi:hypothetical protein
MTELGREMGLKEMTGFVRPRSDFMPGGAALTRPTLFPRLNWSNQFNQSSRFTIPLFPLTKPLPP